MKPVFQWVYAPTTQRAASVATAANGKGISARVQQAFDAASGETGTSFSYLLDTAQRESALKTDAKASTSSAKGMFQFIESTWLQTMKEAGPSLGLGQYADAISVDSSGRYVVADASKRSEILELRSNPEISSLMAGAYTRQNASYLKDTLGRDASAGELYIAHFLGPKGASQFISATQADPTQSAVDLFPRQAAANKSIFYQNGKERTVAEVYADLTSGHSTDPAVDSGAARVMTAFQVVAATLPHTVWDPALGYSDSTNPRQTSSIVTPVSKAETAVQAVSSEAQAPAVEQPAAAFAEPQSSTGPEFQTAAAPSDAFSGLFRTDVSGDSTVSAAFWRGFGQAPAMFDVALAEDSKTEETAPAPVPTSSTTLRASQPGQILDTSRQSIGAAPLDLSRFLNQG